MADTVAHRWVEALSEQECWEQLASRPWGRLAVVVEGHPEVFPVDHHIDGHALLLRTEDGTKWRHAVGGRVCFEVDDIGDDRRGWSVIVVGYGERVFDRGEHPADDDDPWWTSEDVHWLRIVPIKVSGRRVAGS